MESYIAKNLSAQVSVLEHACAWQYCVRHGPRWPITLTEVFEPCKIMKKAQYACFCRLLEYLLPMTFSKLGRNMNHLSSEYVTSVSLWGLGQSITKLIDRQCSPKPHADFTHTPPPPPSPPSSFLSQQISSMLSPPDCITKDEVNRNSLRKAV